MEEISLIFNKPLSFPLWQGVPAGSWLRRQGRTRLVVIDDDIFERTHLFSSGGSRVERVFDERLNLDVEFFSMPEGYGRGPATVSGLFTNAWFSSQLQTRLQDPRPIAAVILDLCFGLDDRPNEPTGMNFLRILRQQPGLEQIPVIVASNISEAPRIRSALKEQGSFQDYIQKSGVNLPEAVLRSVVQWGHVADPTLGAFSLPMRRVAQRMRQIAISEQRIPYESNRSDPSTSFPKPIVFKGELGSGKNYLASCLHRMSVRGQTDYATFTFSGAAGGADTVSGLFGVAPHSKGHERPSFIHTPTGFLLDHDYNRDSLPLNDIGIIHTADVGRRVYSLREINSGEAKPYSGTLNIDELSEAREEYQAKLLEVLNHGRFRPHLSSSLIPSLRRLDVWLLFTCSSNGYEKVRDDLKSRLSRFDLITVPRLDERECDLLPLALRMIALHRPEIESTVSPEDVFTSGAREVLQALPGSISVRQLDGVMNSLGSVTGKLPFNTDEVESACREARVTFEKVGQAAAGYEIARLPPPDAARVEDWLFEKPPKSDVQPGTLPLSRVMAEAASRVLGLLDRALRDEFAGRDLASVKTIPAANIWRRLSSESVESNVALSRIAHLMLIDPGATRRAALESPYIRWVLLSKQLGTRSRTLQDLSIEFENDSSPGSNSNKD